MHHPSAAKVRVLLADDHQMFREALCHLLQSQPDMEVVGQTGDGMQVVDLARKTAPQIVCMDISMPGMDGAEVTRILRTVLPQVTVVALSAYSDQQYVLDMLNAGASGYVTKAEASDELLRAIRTVLSGRTYLCPDVAGVVTGGAGRPGRGGPADGRAGGAGEAGAQTRGRRLYLCPDCRHAEYRTIDRRSAPAQHHAQAGPTQCGCPDTVRGQQRTWPARVNRVFVQRYRVERAALWL